MNGDRKKNLPLLIYNVLMVIFMLAPIVILILVSFSPTRAFNIPTTEWSLQWYAKIASYTRYYTSAIVSLGLAFVAALISTVLGFMSSYAFTRYDFKGKKLFDSLFFSPLTMPAVISGFALLIYVSALGIYDSFTSFVLAHIVLCVPYAIRTINTSIEAVGKDLELSAMNLGASHLKTFLKVTIPLTKTGVAGAFIFAFLVSFGEVVIALFIAGAKMITLPLMLFNNVQDNNSPMIAAISTLLILFAVGLVIIIDKTIGMKAIISSDDE